MINLPQDLLFPFSAIHVDSISTQCQFVSSIPSLKIDDYKQPRQRNIPLSPCLPLRLTFDLLVRRISSRYGRRYLFQLDVVGFINRIINSPDKGWNPSSRSFVRQLFDTSLLRSVLRGCVGWFQAWTEVAGVQEESPTHSIATGCCEKLHRTPELHFRKIHRSVSHKKNWLKIIFGNDSHITLFKPAVFM